MAETDFLLYADRNNVAEVYEKKLLGSKRVDTNPLTESIVDLAFAKAVSETFKSYDKDVYATIQNFNGDRTDYAYIMLSFISKMNDPKFKDLFLENFKKQMTQAQQAIDKALESSGLSHQELSTLSRLEREKALKQGSSIEIKYNGLSITSDMMTAYKAIGEISELSGKKLGISVDYQGKKINFEFIIPAIPKYSNQEYLHQYS